MMPFAGGEQLPDLARDRRWVLWIGGFVLLIILLVSVFAPIAANQDPTPSTYNTAAGGARAAYLTLLALHRDVVQWDQPLEALRAEDAAHTTLVLAEPRYTALEKGRLADALQGFLMRGGRVLVTGAGGALLLPGGAVESSQRLQSLCYTEPEGPSSLARAGKIEMNDPVRWSDGNLSALVSQRCGPDAVVVSLPVGAGEAIWWSSASPLTNAELHNDADLRLLLASLGQGRRVLFDEALHQPMRSSWSATRGLPLWWLLGQSTMVFASLVLSFSRRRGPVRLPVGVPRSSPLEFAVSMGDLYEKAGATGVAIEAARRQLERVLLHEAGLNPATLKAGPEAVSEALRKRLGDGWQQVGNHLKEASLDGEANPTPGSALQLVRALGVDTAEIRRALGERNTNVAGEEPTRRSASQA